MCNSSANLTFPLQNYKKLTASARVKTMGKAKLLIINPIVMNMDNSRHGLVPVNESCVKRRAAIVGNIENK